MRYNGVQPLESEQVKAAIAEAELRLGTTGRLIIRKSGTEPLIRVMGESEDECLLGTVISEVCSVIQQAAH